jgi:cytochrome c biogenesis protein CcmG/thiol:disulfide interchange protein DsbE
MNATQAETARVSKRTLIVLLPLAAFIGLAALFYVGLREGDPSRLPSALIGKPVPKTELPPLAGVTHDGKPVPGLNTDTFKGDVTLLNVWASWCVPCHDEVPLLAALSKDSRIRLVSINYKDTEENARRFLNRYGNPFAATGRDESGRASIEWGVYGVPETYLIGRDGRIAYKLVGPITADNLARALEPEIRKALGQQANGVR